MGIGEVAEILGVGANRVRQFVYEGRLPAAKLPGSTRWAFDAGDVAEFAELERRPGARLARSFDPYESYVRQRIRRNPRVPATRLWDSCVDRGYDRSYETFRAELRRRGLRELAGDRA